MFGLERLFVLCIQIGSSVLVLYAVKNKGFRRYLLLLSAILIHAAVDFPVGLLQKGVGNMWIVGGLEFFWAVVAIAAIILFKPMYERFDKKNAAPTENVPVVN